MAHVPEGSQVSAGFVEENSQAVAGAPPALRIVFGVGGGDHAKLGAGGQSAFVDIFRAAGVVIGGDQQDFFPAVRGNEFADGYGFFARVVGTVSEAE